MKIKLASKCLKRLWMGVYGPTCQVEAEISRGRRDAREMRLLCAAVCSVARPLVHPRTVRLVATDSAAFPPIANALQGIRSKLQEASSGAGRDGALPRLVAVSKTKPVELLRAAYDAGQRDFGENYVQELISKAPEMPDDVNWRFIGKLQSNKAKPLVQGVPSLAVVETVDTPKLADRLQTAVAGLTPERTAPLGVMIQVNTSPWEGSKGGVLAEEASDLAKHIHASCPNLTLMGLMTIGEPGNVSCFDALRECRETVAQAVGVDAASLELSMGMSGDFEAAIAKGSDSVRVGSSIFGARDYPPKKDS